MTIDYIQQTLERLQVAEINSKKSDLEDSAYTILVQSSHSLALRQALTAAAGNEETTSTSLYRQAGLRTPAENAHRDWFGAGMWWKRMVTQMATASKTNQGSVVYLQFLPCGGCSPPIDKNSLQVLDLTINPMGWDEDFKQTQSCPTMNLNSLQSILDGINKLTTNSTSGGSTTRRTTLVMDSLTPLWMRHGGVKLQRFLECLQQLDTVSTILLRVTDGISAATLRAVEDRAHSLLLLDQGEALWMHQGVRERDNMVRKIIDFSLEEDGIQLLQPKKTEEEPTETSVEAETDAQPANTDSTPPRTRGRARVQLKLEEENPPPEPASAPAAGPRIFMQEDDPEFEDYDEEDPDDDLDI